MLTKVYSVNVHLQMYFTTSTPEWCLCTLQIVHQKEFNSTPEWSLCNKVHSNVIYFCVVE